MNMIGKFVYKNDEKSLANFMRYNLIFSIPNVIIFVLLLILSMGLEASGVSAGICVFVEIITLLYVVGIFAIPSANAKMAVYTEMIDTKSNIEVEVYDNQLITYVVNNNKVISKRVSKYKDIKKVRSLPGYYFIYLNSKDAYICPKRKFKGEKSEVKNTFKKALGNRYKDVISN